MLKFCYDNESEIPEAFRAHYKKGGDGKWFLECEGAVAKARVDEFRENNTRLQTELAAEKTKFKDVDPAEYTRLKGIEKDLQDGKLTDKQKDILETRTQEMKTAHATELAKIQGERDGFKKEIEGLKIGEAAVAAGLKLGLVAGAKDDLQVRVSQQFKLNEKGEVRAFNPAGQEIYGATGSPLTIDEYVAGLTKTAAHLFAPSDGTGAGNDAAAAAARRGDQSAVNPWKKETFNVTLQSKLYKENKPEAIRLAKLAGVALT